VLELALAEVARDLGKAQQFAVLVTQRGDGDARPELAAVRTHPPALVLEAPLGGGHLELVLGPAALRRGRRIERGEMPADDLPGRVALDALGAQVPGADVAGGVEDEHRVVAGLLDHHAVKLFFHYASGGQPRLT